MVGLINRILHRGSKRGKSILPNPNLEYRLVFKKGQVDAIKRVKGWKTDGDMARALGFTRAYISMLNKTRATVTATVITRLAVQLGNTEANWWIYFEIVPWGVRDLNHPTWNQEKYLGQVPYDRFSLTAAERRIDYQVEKKRPDL